MNDQQFDQSDNLPAGRGLCCLSCGSQKLRVIYTRRASGNKVVRRRECRKCLKRVTTWEKVIGMG